MRSVEMHIHTDSKGKVALLITRFCVYYKKLLSIHVYHSYIQTSIQCLIVSFKV